MDATSPALNLPAFSEQRYIAQIVVDKQIGLQAQSLQVAGVAGLKPADAIHIASAPVGNVPIFHTSDLKLLDLNQHLTMNDGKQLTIIRPTEDEPPNLFTGMQP